jgi:hypothetical protein
MFNSAVLDLAAGLIFTFLAASLATGAIVEAIASLLVVRAITLRKGIGQLLNDPNIARWRRNYTRMLPSVRAAMEPPRASACGIEKIRLTSTDNCSVRQCWTF